MWMLASQVAPVTLVNPSLPSRLHCFILKSYFFLERVKNVVLLNIVGKMSFIRVFLSVDQKSPGVCSPLSPPFFVCTIEVMFYYYLAI